VRVGGSPDGLPRPAVTFADDDHRTAIFGTRMRFVMMLLVLFCLASIWSNILSFNFAVICMGSTKEKNDNTTSASNAQHIFTAYQRSMLTSTVAVAALAANFPVVALVNQFGIRMVFTFLGLFTALSTCLIPAAIQAGFYYFLAVRFLQGIAFAANFPVIGSFCSRWAYYKQNGMFVSCLVAYLQLSPAVTMPVSGVLCEYSGWQSVFYVHGGASFILFITYGLFYRNNPQKHPMVSDTELNKISIGKVYANKKDLKNIPYGAILRTPAVWAVWTAAIGNFTCVNMLFLFSPIYINKVLGFEVHDTGLRAAFAPLAQFCMKLAIGVVSDKMKMISETNKLRLFNSIAFFGSAALLCVLSLMNTENRTLCMLVMGSSAGILGATTGGFFKAGPLISKQYSHFVTGNVSLGVAITMLFVPLVKNIIAPEDTAEQWTWVFVATAIVMVLTNIIFCVFGSGEPCEWTTERYILTHSTRSLPDSSAKQQHPVTVVAA
uniref:Major facilitator superfamily (MFS) profile domain-containing protein n=1 Tax=Parascaris univalens TaxID=6257 RepID=A0A915B003_PARUN